MLSNFISQIAKTTMAVGLALALGNTALADDFKARFAVDGFVLGTLVRVADDKGFFAEEGVDPTLVTFSYGVDTVDAVLAGQVDFGVIIDMPLLSRLSSDKLMVPALIGTPNPGWHKLYVADGTEVPAGLKGKRLAVASGTAQEFVTRIHLRDAGIDPDKDVELVGFASLFEIIAAMKAKRVDAAWIWGQGIEQLGENSGYGFVADDSIVNQKTTALLVASKDYAANNPEALSAILRAMDKAADVVADDVDAAAAIVASGIAGDASKIKPIILGQNYALSFEPAAMASLKAKYDFLVESGVIDPPYDYAAQFDLETLRAAAPDVAIVDSLD